MTATTHRADAALTDPRIVRSREVLRGALLRLIEDRAFEQITIRDIAAAAGLSHVTFYRHRLTKDTLLHEIAAGEVDRLTALMLPALDASDVRSASIALCTYVESHRRLWTTLLTGGAAGVLRDELLKCAVKITSTRTSPTHPVPADLVIAFNVSGTIEVLTWWLRQPRPNTIEEIAEIIEHVVIAPIFSANQPGRRAARKRRGPSS